MADIPLPPSRPDVPAANVPLPPTRPNPPEIAGLIAALKGIPEQMPVLPLEAGAPDNEEQRKSYYSQGVDALKEKMSNALYGVDPVTDGVYDDTSTDGQKLRDWQSAKPNADALRIFQRQMEKALNGTEWLQGGPDQFAPRPKNI